MGLQLTFPPGPRTLVDIDGPEPKLRVSKSNRGSGLEEPRLGGGGNRKGS